MVDLDVLDQMGSTQERLKQIFTATPKSTPAEREMLQEEVMKRIDGDCKLRDAFESDINKRFSEQVNYSLRNCQMYGAVDLAWDAPPINKATYPLLLYAQGRLDLGKCQKALEGLPDEHKYVTKKPDGTISGINIPKFFECNFNFVRSVITRRLAAQTNKYRALFPYYKYEPRSTSQVGKLRADVFSQVTDIMADGFNYRHHDEQVMRDAMLYGHSLDFVRSAWEVENRTVFEPGQNPDLIPQAGKRKLTTVITKEGLGFINPHPTRIFWDNMYPLSEINTDTGPRFLGFWDVWRYGDVAKNPKYWNRTTIQWSSTVVQLFSTYAQYFSQYYCTINPPCNPQLTDIAAANDRLNQANIYAQDMLDSSMIVGEYFRKIIPKDHGIGDYPYPVWLRMVIAGDRTVIYAEFLPSTPAALLSINENDSRQLNISIGMELLPYQDQMTQLLSLLLKTIQASMMRVLLVDKDTADAEVVKAFRADMANDNRYPTSTVFEYSSAKMQQLGVNPQQIMHMVQSGQDMAGITIIFQAMAELVKLAERLMALSPQELGQPAPSGISATESNIIAGTTETIYGFITDSIDDFRNAKKRIIYESYITCAQQDFRVPVIGRYSDATVKKAGLTVVNEDDETTLSTESTHGLTVMGTKSQVEYDYIFTSRDGAQRSPNAQLAQALVQLVNVLKDPMIMAALPKSKFYEIINEIFRMAGVGVDLKLEVAEGESEKMGVDPANQQLQQLLQQLTEEIKANAQAIKDVNGHLEKVIEVVDTLTAQVKEIRDKPEAQAVDPVRAIKARREQQKMALEAQQASQDMTQSAQGHNLKMGIQSLRALEDVRQKRSAFAREAA